MAEVKKLRSRGITLELEAERLRHQLTTEKYEAERMAQELRRVRKYSQMEASLSLTKNGGSGPSPYASRCLLGHEDRSGDAALLPSDKNGRNSEADQPFSFISPFSIALSDEVGITSQSTPK